jgi:hypothetical protein
LYSRGSEKILIIYDIIKNSGLEKTDKIFTGFTSKTSFSLVIVQVIKSKADKK